MAFIYDLTDTWNAGGTTFNAIKMNVTDSASAAASKLVTLQVGGAEKFGVRKDGLTYVAGSLGVGTSSPAVKLEVSGGIGDVIAGNAQVFARSGDNTNFNQVRIRATATESRLESLAAGTGTSSPLVFHTGGSERMRIDSSGRVGIGTTAPDKALTISASDSQIRLYDADGTNQFASIQSDNGTAKITSRDNTSNGTIAFQRFDGTTVSESMRITSSGNVGIGTAVPDGTLVVSAGTNGTASTGGYIGFTTGANNSKTRGAGIEAFSLTSSNDHGLRFYTNASTASPAERMRIDSSGNVGIGTSSPSYKVSVGAAGDKIGFASGSSYGYWQPYDTSGNMNFAVNWSGGSTEAITFTTGTSEKVRIDSSGRVGVGTTSPNTQLTVEGSACEVAINDSAGSIAGLRFRTSGSTKGVIQADSTSNLRFSSGATERMRIDSSGNLLVGTSSFSFNPTQGVTAAGGSVGAVGIGHASGTAEGNGYINFAYNGGNIGSVTQSGTTAVLYNTSSDARLKENIADADDASSLIDAIQVRKFDWKADGSHQRYGMVAQELLEVAPEAVSGDPEGEEMMGVDYSKLVPMLIKEVQQLRARVAQLEGN